MINGVFREDIEEIITSPEIPWVEMKNSTILITGATGLIGNALVHALAVANEKYGLGLRIIAHGRNAAKGEALSEDCGVEVVCSDIRDPLTSIRLIADMVDYIFHCASITRSADMVARPADVITTAIEGTRNVLELAREKQSRSVVYLSSMEIYGQTNLSEVRESDLGFLDLSNSRSSYPESKRMCESLCVAYHTQYGVPIKIARLARTFGAGTTNNENDMRVANQFAHKALACEDIELHTPGNSVANCCYTSDAVHGLLTILLKGADSEAYNIANPAASVTIREMAELVATEVCDGRIKVVVNVPDDIQKRGYALDVGFTLNIDKLKTLGWKPKHGLDEMYKRMLADWQEGQI